MRLRNVLVSTGLVILCLIPVTVTGYKNCTAPKAEQYVYTVADAICFSKQCEINNRISPTQEGIHLLPRHNNDMNSL